MTVEWVSISILQTLQSAKSIKVPYNFPLTTDGSFSVIQERRPQIKLSFNHNFPLYRSHILHFWSLLSTNDWWSFWRICNCIFKKKQDSWFYAYITADLLTWKSSFPMLILPRLTSIKQMPSISLALGWRCSVHKLKTTQRTSGVFLQESSSLASSPLSNGRWSVLVQRPDWSNDLWL